MTHELVHIKHNDVFIKLMGIFVIAIHWFNPFVYLFVGELSCISEMYCDSVVMEGKGAEERKKYEDLLLRLIAEKVSFHKEKFVMGFANLRKKNMYKRRILELKEDKKEKAVLSVMMTVFLCIAGGVTVCAYQPPSTISTDRTDPDFSTEFYVREITAFSPEELVSDHFAVSDDGTIYDLCHTDETDGEVCEHQYSISVEVVRHRKKSDNDCTKDRYDGLKCTKCDDIKYGEFLYSSAYMPCPH